MHDRAWLYDKMGLHSEGPEGPRPTPMVVAMEVKRARAPRGAPIGPQETLNGWKGLSNKNMILQASDRITFFSISGTFQQRQIILCITFHPEG